VARWGKHTLIKLGSDKLPKAYGSKQATLNPFAVEVMKENGTLTFHQKKQKTRRQLYNYIVTVCDEAVLRIVRSLLELIKK
jgi:hypothetical protein